MSEARQERRKSPRRRTLKNGRIVFNNRGSTIDCVVRNLSPQGALLILPSIIGVPDVFELYIDGENARDAYIVWKGDGRVGVVWA